MKKLVILMILMVSTIVSYSQDGSEDKVKDFRVFVEGKKEYLAGDYEKAKESFKVLERKYPDSLVITNNYANYYIGMNYYELGDNEAAKKYLERAVYIPKEYTTGGYFKKKKTSYFEYERALALANIARDEDNDKDEMRYLKSLIKPYFTKEITPYEKKALKRLGDKDSYYKTYYDVKYNENLKLISKIKEEELIPLGDFFVSKGRYKNAVATYAKFLDYKKDHKVRLKKLEALTRAKEYNKIVVETNRYLGDSTPNEQWDFHYYKGYAYRRLGKVSLAIEQYKKVGKGKTYNQARYQMAWLYFIQKKYDETIFITRDLDTNQSQKLLLESYLGSNRKKEFKEEAVKYIEKYPYSEDTAYYEYTLYNLEKDDKYLRKIIDGDYNNYYYEVAISIVGSGKNKKNYPLNEKLEEYSDQLEKLEALSKLGDEEVLKMNFENLKLKEEDKAFEGYLISMVYEEIGEYHEAIKNSIKYRKYISEYNNLLPILYPKYYKDIVEAKSVKYGVEPEVVYSIIKQESLFNEDVVSRSAAYGLMQLVIPTARDMRRDVTPEELIKAEVNIDLGTKYIAMLVKRYKGNIPKAVAAYNGGMGNVDKWKKDENGELIIESIPFTETRRYTKRVLNNYYKYKSIYN